MKYPQGIGSKFAIQGKLRPAKALDLPEHDRQYGYNLSVNVHRIGKRRKCVDEGGRIWLKVNGLWWKFPEEIEY